MEVKKAMFVLNCLLEKHKAVEHFCAETGNDRARKDHAEICEAIKTITDLVQKTTLNVGWEHET